MLRRFTFALAALLALAAFSAVAADRHVVLLPTSIALSSPEARQTLVVQWQAGEQLQDQAADAKFSSSDEKVVKVEEGVAVPTGNGEATITAKVGEQTA